MTQSSRNLVLEPEQIAAGVDALLLDLRPEADFLAQHARGAVRLSIDVWEKAAKTPGGALSQTTFWAEAIGRLGVDGSTQVAVYDDGRMTEAARAWFILQHFGVPATVVNGGWPALLTVLKEAGATEQGAPPPPRRAVFTPRPGSGVVALVERVSLRDALARGTGPQVLDARTAAEFRGEDLRANRRGGNLPGARHLAHAALLGLDGRLRAPEDLRGLIDQAGFNPGERVVTHCDGGGRAALAALAAAQAGYSDVGAYYLSFADWAADEACSLER
ncbi:sulfurtransferase [Roseomonas mucosa]|uniref:sulfurtransferase n=1 Tax=Roseomonas mucosa TaxID=207340 RepID=UPI001DC11968|nr:rhodanese-like domain-containing protein [Roseomonas mucosa]MBS5904712.1 hypothetical protein [Acetobacteraceae bacterium]MCG7354583.1 hypothetical protein [Roseomonas mucosa]MDT8313241.1 rhodanese-like domain-containing protein [Roseomonas mucosa]MDT8359253.1 rhodanese-like domain-containing protein [Roseomonas mucosa]